jgi:hypothetical protein
MTNDYLLSIVQYDGSNAVLSMYSRENGLH